MSEKYLGLPVHVRRSKLRGYFCISQRPHLETYPGMEGENVALGRERGVDKSSSASNPDYCHGVLQINQRAVQSDKQHDLLVGSTRWQT